MNWTLNFEIEPHNILDYRDKFLLVGSCFTENIGAELVRHGIDSYINPHGIAFNPHSIAHSLISIRDNKTYQVEDLKYDPKRELYFSFEHHGSFSNADPETAVIAMNDALMKAQAAHESAVLIITLGTAWIYRHRETADIVANCHKQLSSVFEKELMSVEMVESELTRIAEAYPSNKIVWTLSPVKHVRDGIVENSRSKAILLEAIHRQLQKQNNHYYFPAFEIMMDELRDHRFYEPDMVHPSREAREYIWKRFVETMFNASSQDYLKETNKLLKAINHKPIHDKSREAVKFAENLEQNIKSHAQKWKVDLQT